MCHWGRSSSSPLFKKTSPWEIKKGNLLTWHLFPFFSSLFILKQGWYWLKAKIAENSYGLFYIDTASKLSMLPLNSLDTIISGNPWWITHLNKAQLFCFLNNPGKDPLNIANLGIVCFYFQTRNSEFGMVGAGLLNILLFLQKIVHFFQKECWLKYFNANLRNCEMA